jgi:hypothetical protein
LFGVNANQTDGSDQAKRRRVDCRFRTDPQSTPFSLRQPLVETDAADSCIAERHERLFLDKTAVVPRVACRVQITRDDLRERRTVRASDLDDAVQCGLSRYLSDDRRSVVRRNRLKQSIGDAHRSTLRAEIRDTAMNSMNCVARTIAYGTPAASISFSCATLAAKYAFSGVRSQPTIDSAT